MDHPSTQTDKLAKVNKIFGGIPAHVTFVPIDFNTQTVEVQLSESDFDSNSLTLFIWQGVTMYLTTKAVDDMLKFVVEHSAPGSAIVFDYIYRKVLEGVEKRSEISSMHRYRFMTGEGLTFGVEEGAIEEFVKERGFRQARDISTDELKQTYFTSKNAERKIARGYGIVVATV